MRLVISDQHAGLVAAITRTLQGSSHQRCRVHFIRNVLAHVPKGEAEMVAALFRTIFAQPDLDSMSRQWDKVRDDLTARYPKIGPVMDAAKTEVLAFAAFPREHWRKIWSTNPLERLNKEIKRRARVVEIFPNECRRHPPRRSRPGRHPRRVARRRPPLPLRSLHGQARSRPRY